MLKLHFLNVGHGDCTIVEFPSGRTMMVDINNSSLLDEESEKELASHFNIDYTSYLVRKSLGMDPFSKQYNIQLTDPVKYYKSILGNKEIFRFVCTHPDMDHLSGLHQLSKEESIAIINLWDTNHKFTKDEEDFNNQSKFDKRDWDAYLELRNTVNTSPKTLFLERNASGQFYADDGIYVLATTKDLINLAHEKDDPNHLSYVLMIVYGQHKIILGGDATTDVWQNILDEFGPQTLKSSILKASHHGRDSGYHADSVKAINPKYTIISVGKKPETDASNKYRQYSENVWSTRWKGNIVLTCHEDGTIDTSTEYDR